MEIKTSQAGEIHVIKIRGKIPGASVPALVQAVQAVLNEKGLNLVLDLEDCEGIGATAFKAMVELARKLGRVGGALVLAGAKDGLFGSGLDHLKADPDVILASSRGEGMSLLLTRLSVRGELLGFIRSALSTMYVSPTAPDVPVICSFVKHLQNFLVYSLEPPYDGTLQRGMTLRFTMHGCGEEGTKTVSFDGQIHRFASLKDGTPCLMVKVPDLLEISEDRREEPRLRVRFSCAYNPKGAAHKKKYGTLHDISATGLSMTAPSFSHTVGQVIEVVPDFQKWKLQEPLQVEVLHVAHDGGETKVGGTFVYVNPTDLARIEQLILESSKW